MYFYSVFSFHQFESSSNFKAIIIYRLSFINVSQSPFSASRQTHLSEIYVAFVRQSGTPAVRSTSTLRPTAVHLHWTVICQLLFRHNVIDWHPASIRRFEMGSFSSFVLFPYIINACTIRAALHTTTLAVSVLYISIFCVCKNNIHTIYIMGHNKQQSRHTSDSHTTHVETAAAVAAVGDVVVVAMAAQTHHLPPSSAHQWCIAIIVLVSLCLLRSSLCCVLPHLTCVENVFFFVFKHPMNRVFFFYSFFL